MLPAGLDAFFPFFQHHYGPDSRSFAPTQTVESRSSRTINSRDRRGQAHPTRQKARSMKGTRLSPAAPLIPGGFDPPAQKRIHPKGLPPAPSFQGRRALPAPPTPSGAPTEDQMPPSALALSPGPNPMSLSTINSSDDRR